MRQDSSQQNPSPAESRAVDAGESGAGLGENRDAVLDLADMLFDAAREGKTDLLCAYIDAGAPADLKNATGDSLLMLAAYHGHAETVTALAGRGSDVNLVNDRNQSPLAGAVFKGEDAVVEALLAAGADPHAGRPSAVETARYFDKADLAERLESGS